MVMLILPFVFQGLAMFVDEIYFHRKRGLPLWERIGHPLDTLSVLACYVFIFFNAPTEKNLNIYIGLCVFSCLLVTKDEFVHSEICDPAEQWLHSLLFVLHPVTFLAAALIWKNQNFPQFLAVQPLVILLVMLYQIIYWSFIWKKPSLK